MKHDPDPPEAAEQELSGGAQTAGIVRVGPRVHRPRHARSDYVRQLLQHLERVGFAGAPRYLGVDERGREILSYFEGEVLVGSPACLPDPRIISASRLIRRFHDATAGTALGDH